MYIITEAVVVAYVAGAVTCPDLRAAIEEARDADPQVRYWFDLYDPQAEEDDDLQDLKVRPAQDADVDVSRHSIEWALGLENESRHKPTSDLPVRHFDAKANTLTLKYPAESVPLGVARLEVKSQELPALAPVLVVFRTYPRGKGQVVRVAEVGLDELGLTPKKDSGLDEPGRTPKKGSRLDVELYVVPATASNLAGFSPEQVRALRDRCNGDEETRAVVETLLKMIEAQGK